MIDNILKDWKTTIPGIVVLLIQILNTFGVHVTPELAEILQWIAGLLLLISKDPNSLQITVNQLDKKGLLKHPAKETMNLFKLPSNPFKEKF